MRQLKGIALGLAAVVLMAAGTACSSQPQEKLVTGPASEAVLAYSEAKTDNLLAAMARQDYVAFSRDLDDGMKTAMPQDKFLALCADLKGKIGDFQSRQVDSVRQSGDFTAVVYAARYSLIERVTLRVVFRTAEPHGISGLWFN